MFTNKDSAQVREFLQSLKAALLACASSLQYEDSTLPAHQMGQTVLPEKFTAKQQQISRLDGGLEEDGVTTRPLLETTNDERQGHEVLEHRRADAERRPASNCYSQVPLTGCHQSLAHTYRLPQRIGTIQPLDELGMANSPTSREIMPRTFVLSEVAFLPSCPPSSLQMMPHYGRPASAEIFAR